MFAPDWLSIASAGILTTLTGNPAGPITLRVRQQRIRIATRSSHIRLKFAARRIKLSFRINQVPEL